MHRKSLDLMVVITITAIALALSLSELNLGFVRPILALLLTFVLPGYAWTAAMFPRWSMRFSEQSVLSLGLSFVIVILGGLFLTLTTWGLQSKSWALYLGSVTLIATGIAFGVQRKETGEKSPGSRLGVKLNLRHMVIFGLAIIVITGAIGISRIGAIQQSYPGFTQLWITPAGDEQSAVRLGVNNQESMNSDYRLQLKINDKILSDWASIKLKPGEKWETTIVLPTQQAEVETIEAVLYRSGDSEESYRWVRLQRVKRENQ